MNLFLYSLLFFSLPIILAADPTDADSRQIIVNLPCSSNPSRHFTLTAKRISARVGALDIGEVELLSPINGPWTNVSCTRTSRKNSTTVIAHLHFTTNREDLTVLLQPHFTVQERGGWECTRALVAFGLFKGNETERELAWTLGGKELEAISWRASSRERGFKCHNSRLGVNSANRVDFDDLRILPHAEMGADEMRESDYDQCSSAPVIVIPLWVVGLIVLSAVIIAVVSGGIGYYCHRVEESGRTDNSPMKY